MTPDIPTAADHIGLILTGGYLVCALAPVLASRWRIEPRWGRVAVAAAIFGILAVLR